MQIEAAAFISHGRAPNRKSLVVKAPTGHISVVFPEKYESKPGSEYVTICKERPRCSNPITASSAISSWKRTQRPHWMQRSRSRYISSPNGRCLKKCFFSSYRKRLLPEPYSMVRFCSGHSPPLSQTGQSNGCDVSRNSMISLRALTTSSVKPRTSIPSETMIVQAVSSLGANWTTRLPSSLRLNSPVSRFICGRPISTRHIRHIPTGSILGW